MLISRPVLSKVIPMREVPVRLCHDPVEGTHTAMCLLAIELGDLHRAIAARDAQGIAWCNVLGSHRRRAENVSGSG